MAGRIESYIHSDSITMNKGGAIAKIISQTDFASRTPQFIEFAKLVAKMAYAADSDRYSVVVDLFPIIEASRKELMIELRENVIVDEIKILKI